MEKRHRSRLLADFRFAIEHKPLYVLDVPDKYKFIDLELVRSGVPPSQPSSMFDPYILTAL